MYVYIIMYLCMCVYMYVRMYLCNVLCTCTNNSVSVTAQGVSHRLLIVGVWVRSQCSISGIPGLESDIIKIFLREFPLPPVPVILQNSFIGDGQRGSQKRWL